MRLSRPKRFSFGRLRRLSGDSSGASAVEFAMLVGPFLAIIIITIELAVDYLFFAQLDYAVHKSAEQFRTGAVVAEKMNVKDFREKVLCPQLSLFDCERIVVNAIPIDSFDAWMGARAWSASSVNPAISNWCPGGSGTLVLLQVAYPVPLASLIWAGATSNVNGVRYYVSSNGFRNDVFALRPPSTAGC